jgi:glycosyltransferase involved in cell wall biosynthesis
VDSIHTIYNPFDIEQIKKLANEPLTDSWFQHGEPPVILGIGRLVPQKGFHVLIKAFAQVLKTMDARLLILGDGPEYRMLKELASSLQIDDERLSINTFVANPFVYLARCKVFVLSSFWEGLPGVLIEALACGANVVSTDCPSGPREILEDGKWGKLVAVDCPEMLSRAILDTIISDRATLPDVRFRAGQFAKDKIVNEYLSIMKINCTDN